MPLTDIKCKNAKPSDRVQRLFDGGGLYLEVMISGARYWRMKYRHMGKEKRLAFGVYPEVTLSAARDARDDARALLRQGRDPAAEKKATKLRARIAADNTFKAIGNDWLQVCAPKWTPLQLKKETRRLENHAYPWIGDLPITEIGVAEIRPLLDRLVKAGHLEQAHRVREQLSRVFLHAAANEKGSRDPAKALEKYLPPRVYKRYPTITDPDKAAELLRAIDGFGGTFPVRCALRLAPLLFVRPGELRAAEWKEFDLSHRDGARWVIPPERRKLKKAQKEHPDAPAHFVPLAEQAIAIIRELEPLTGGGRRYLFPGARSAARPMSENTINASLRRLGFDKDAMTGHGFRHMASTMLNEMGFNKDAIERQLAHKEPGVGGIYNLAQHLPERRTMMQAWADHLDNLRAGNKVVPIHRKFAGRSR
ncbi:MAG TPA: integrase arm-type DNA-binding domain-containing protein [Arenimonas sp.]|uniref:tyrosine-type recombinase/integrase n=1 Tax=Arenimonas sp. TaxID=1872635 RepID=UPI002CA99234|nr:integrase arm-type DNA-binding domain-containing protein [Arenimonas sp.]HMB57815.1 integrase arm-type DNA-binding domain-containing protein [Arenimonas sp.]